MKLVNFALVVEEGRKPILDGRHDEKVQTEGMPQSGLRTDAVGPPFRTLPPASSSVRLLSRTHVTLKSLSSTSELPNSHCIIPLEMPLVYTVC